MSNEPTRPAEAGQSELYSDNAWRKTRPEQGLGYLGGRYLCLLDPDGRKRLLVRRPIWTKEEPPLRPARGLFGLPPGEGGWAVPITELPTSRERVGGQEQPVTLFCQRIDRLSPMSDRLKDLFARGELRRAHRLLANACEVLKEFAARIDPKYRPGKSAQARDDPEAGVPMQSPASLATDGERVVLLDAGYVLDHHPMLESFYPDEFARYF
jgi:hypothetical protein